MGALSVAIVAAVLVAVGTFDRDERHAHVLRDRRAHRRRRTSASAAAPTDVSEIYKRVSPGVVYIASRTAQGQASGSGFVVDTDGHDRHQRPRRRGRPQRLRALHGERRPDRRQGRRRRPVDRHRLLDVDASKVEGGVKPLQLGRLQGRSCPASPRSPSAARSASRARSPSGIVSALDREIQAPNGFTISGVIQTDAAINPGNSGGPLLDDEGRVIGVNSQIATNGTDANSGVGFAVPIDTVKSVVPQLKEDGKIDRAFLGVSTAEPRRATARWSAGHRPARRTPDFEPGDLITEFDGRKIKSASDLGQAVLTRKPGDTVKVVVQRDGDCEDARP